MTLVVPSDKLCATCFTIKPQSLDSSATFDRATHMTVNRANDLAYERHEARPKKVRPSALYVNLIRRGEE